jgi:hypothetical protein
VSHLGVGNGTVARVWREHGIQPWRVETFKFSTDPELVAKITDIVGLYLDPPENAIVLCVDEKSQIQALDRAAPTLRCRSGSPSVTGGRPVRPTDGYTFLWVSNSFLRAPFCSSGLVQMVEAGGVASWRCQHEK